MFKQANRNIVLLSIGQGKRKSLETNLVSENERAIYSKARQFRLSARKQLPSSNGRKFPAWTSGKARNLVPRAFVHMDKGNEEGSGHEIVSSLQLAKKQISLV